MSPRFGIFLLALGVVLAATASQASAAAPADFAGHWEGVIELPGMDPGLTVQVDLQLEGAVWTGTIDIPMQGAKGLALAGIAATTDSVRFAIAGIPGDPTFAGRLEGGAIRGTFTQGGSAFPFRLGREAMAGAARPQEPKPPFPYRAEEVTVPNGGITLAGTLTLPEGDGPFPAVVLVSGSGPQDRDEMVFQHRPFLILADRLARAGIAALRYDDRGFGKSTGDFRSATTEDFAQDALAAVRFLRGRPEVAAERIGILGHSEGGLVAPMAAGRSKEVAFVILLAGPGVSGGEILEAQTEKIALAGGASPEDAAKQAELIRRAVALVRSEPDSQKVHDAAMEIAREQVALMSEEERQALGENIDAMLEQQVAALTTPWFRFFLDYDPRPALTRLQVPVLALNGGLDTQVPPVQNLPEIHKALAAAGNRDATVVELPGLNHLFQKATTGAPDEYFGIEETMNPAALDAISGWIRERFVEK